MAKPRLRGVLLCEDKEHERFFSRLLRRWFGGPHKLRIERIPNNQGAGTQWVMKNYAREVQFARSKRGENYALAVAIDGDRDKLENRLRQLDQQLVEAGLPKRKTDEMIAVFVPTRNIETWELWLCGDREVDEEGDFKRPFEKARHTGDASTKAAVAAWFRSLSPEDSELERQVLPSLADGRVETARLDRRRS